MNGINKREAIDLSNVEGQEVDKLMDFFEDKITKPEYHTESLAKINPSKPGWMVKIVTTDESMRRRIFPILQFFNKHKIGFAKMNDNPKNKNYCEIEMFHQENCALEKFPKYICEAVDEMNIFYTGEEEIPPTQKSVEEEIMDDIKLSIAHIDKHGIVTDEQISEIENALAEDIEEIEIEVEEKK
jgi:hypothetical protein